MDKFIDFLYFVAGGIFIVLIVKYVCKVKIAQCMKKDDVKVDDESDFGYK